MHNEAHYLQLLLNLGTQHPVAAGQAIYNREDTLLMGAGSPIDAQALSHLTEQPLRQPLLNSLSIHDGLTQPQLCQDIAQLLSPHAAWRALLGPVEELPALFPASLLAQHLTVMRTLYPALYQRTLRGALLSFCLARQLQASHVEHIWLAALGRLCGQLYLPAELIGKHVSKKHLQLQLEHYPESSWLALQHDLPGESALWLAQHQESLTGSGFPNGQQEPAPLAAQLLGIGDWYALLCELHGELSLQACRPALQMLRERWQSEVFQALQHCAAHTAADFQPRHSLTENRQWLNALLNQQGQGQSRLRRLQQQLAGMPAQRSASALMFNGLVNELLHTCASAGLLSDEYQRWVLYVHDQRLEAASEEMHGLELQISVLNLEMQRANHLAERLGLGQVGRYH